MINKKLLKLFFFLGIFFGKWPAVYLQSPHPAFRQYTSENGLPSSDIYQVKQDSKGYIWFATANGVSRFNGYEFENFSISEGLPDNIVFEIAEDPIGRIWFLPISCKISYYDYHDGKIHAYEGNDSLQYKYRFHSKSSFHITKDGTMYIGLYNDGIYKINPYGKITHIPVSDTEVFMAIEPEKGHFLFSNSSQPLSDRNIIIRDRQKTIKLALNDPIPKTFKFGRIIRTSDEKILLSHGSKLYIIHPDLSNETLTFPTTIHTIYEDSDHDLWIGTYLNGVYFIKGRDFKHKKQFLYKTSVIWIIEDFQHGFWFATEGNSVFYTPSKKILTYDYSDRFRTNKVNSLATDGNMLFAGISDGSLYMIDKKGESRVFDMNSKNLTSNSLNELYYDSLTKKLWYSAPFLSGNIHTQTLKTTPLKGIFNEMTRDNEGSYWTCSSSGIGIVSPDNILVNTNQEYKKRLYSIQQYNDTTLIAGGYDGLYLFSKKKLSYTYLGDRHPLLKSRISQIRFNDRGQLIIATKGAGILICGNSFLYQINTKNGLTDDHINAIYMDSTSIWLATNKGVDVIRFKNKIWSSYSVRHLGVYDGLVSDEVNDILRMDKNLWIASNKGLSIINLDEWDADNFTPPVYLTELNAGGHSIITGQSLPISYADNNIKLHYIALDFKKTEKIAYRYKMEGLDTAWNYTENREVQYPNLAPGKYRFVVQIAGKNGRWDKGNKTSIDFSIRKPFWKTYEFQLGIILAGIFLVFLLIRWRSRILQKKKIKNERLKRNMLSMKLKSLRAQMNPHFTYNVLNSIQHFILNNDEESANRYLTKFSRLMRAILNNSEKNNILITEEIKALELYMELEAMRFDHNFEFSIYVDPSINPYNTKIPSMIIQPYIENAINHGILPSAKPGKISVSLTREENVLKCVIEDNGIGRKKAIEIAQKSGHKSMGTNITRERLVTINEFYKNSQFKAYERTIDLLDKNGEPAGTRVEIFIPLNLSEEI